MLVIEGSVTVVLLKIANASRWRSGDDGVVNWKTNVELGPLRWSKCETYPQVL